MSQQVTREEAKKILKAYVKSNRPTKVFAYNRGKSAHCVYEAVRNIGPWLAKEAGLVVKRKVTRIVETTYEVKE